MARRKVKRGHRLSLEAQLKGVRAALRSRRTPPQLKEGLRKRTEQLERELSRSCCKTRFKLLSGHGFNRAEQVTPRLRL